MIIEIAKTLGPRRLRCSGMFGLLSLCLIFVTAQLITVQHTHDGELAHELDCPVCAKQSNELEVVSVSQVSCHVFGCIVIDEDLSFSLTSASIYGANSRSPPTV